MSAATVSINRKLADGTLIQVGGSSYDDFYANLLALNNGDTAATEAAIAEVRAAYTPISAGFTAPPVAAPPQTYQQAQNVIEGQFGQTQPVAPQAPAGAPGPAPIGENGRPKKWVPPGVSKKTGRPYNGFWAEDNPRY